MEGLDGENVTVCSEHIAAVVFIPDGEVMIDTLSAAARLIKLSQRAPEVRASFKAVSMEVAIWKEVKLEFPGFEI